MEVTWSVGDRTEKGKGMKCAFRSRPLTRRVF